MKKNSLSYFEDDIHYIALGNEKDYLLWQKNITEFEGDIYFEYEDQSKGGYNIVKEATIDRDGIHLVLRDESLVHYYFEKEFDEYSLLKEALEKMYVQHRDILEFLY